MKKIRWGATVCVYNRDLWIGPYLEMLQEFGVEPVVTLGTKSWGSQSNDEVIEIDKTEKVLETYFSTVPVIKDSFPHHGDSLNVGIENLQHCDFIMVVDCDVFLTKNDWLVAKKLVEEAHPQFDTFAMNHETMIQEYYYDWRYGQPAIMGGIPPIFAVKKGTRMKDMTRSTGGNGIIWDDPDLMKFHHFRWCKPNASGKVRCVEPSPDNIDKFNGDTFEPAPQEIVERLIKWKKLVKQL